MNYGKYFSLPPDEIYVNCASQGPLCKASSDAVLQGVKDKQNPSGIDMSYGALKAKNCRGEISKLIDHSADYIALADSTSWGVNLIARGLKWKPGDEVVVFEGQFPSNVAPWEFLNSQGVRTVKIPSEDYIVDIKKFESYLGPKTKVACLEWVHWISGDRIPLNDMLHICRKKNILVVVDVTQGLGAIPFSMKEYPVDAIFCSGYKWLLSPYGSGFFAINETLLNQIEISTVNWLSFLSVQKGNISKCHLDLCKTASRFDVYSYMGFLNIDGLTASVKWLNSLDMDDIYSYARELSDMLAEGLDSKYFKKLNSGDKSRQSLISTFTIQGRDPAKMAQSFKDHKIFVTIRDGNLRVSPHIYNDNEQILRLTKVANAL